MSATVLETFVFFCDARKSLAFDTGGMVRETSFCLRDCENLRGHGRLFTPRIPIACESDKSVPRGRGWQIIFPSEPDCPRVSACGLQPHIVYFHQQRSAFSHRSSTIACEYRENSMSCAQPSSSYGIQNLPQTLLSPSRSVSPPGQRFDRHGPAGGDAYGTLLPPSKQSVPSFIEWRSTVWSPARPVACFRVTPANVRDYIPSR